MSTTDIEIACIVRSGPKTDCTCITHVRGIAGTLFSVSEVLILLNMRTTRFFVRDPKTNEISFVTSAERSGRRYIRTRPDDDRNDNLLSLDDCTSTV